MKRRALLAALFLTASPATPQTDAQSFVLSAAKRADRSVRWRPTSVVSGNFTCRGKTEFAILGTSAKEIVIAVFERGRSKPLDLMRFSGVARNPNSAILAVEPLNFTVEEFEREVGPVPDGLRPSKTCVGLNMTDQVIDSEHIYWHRRAARFGSWSR